MEFLGYLAFGETGWSDELRRGLLVTVSLAAVTFPIAMFLSFLICWSKKSANLAAKLFGHVYATLFKSLPEILTLLILYYQAQALVSWAASRFSADATWTITPFLAGVVALGVVISAYGADVVAASLRAIEKSQYEASFSLGLSSARTFLLIILPQLWRHALPGFGNLWVILLKDTSLVSVIMLSDMMHFAGQAITSTKQPFLFYGVISAVYVLMVTLSMAVQRKLEIRAARGFHARPETSDA